MWYSHSAAVAELPALAGRFGAIRAMLYTELRRGALAARAHAVLQPAAFSNIMCHLCARWSYINL